MIKHNFKVGDKVKLKSNYVDIFRLQGTKVGEIIEFDGKYIRVKFKGRLWGFPYISHEIEHAVGVGEQLQFAFMKGE